MYDISRGVYIIKKKIKPITGIGSEDKLTVQKSLPLFALWQSELTLPEFKILDIYLSRIDSHKPEKRSVIFEKGEMEKILGIRKINNKDLKIRLKHLMGNVVEIPDMDEKKGFRLVTLFEEAEAELDECGLWKIKLEATQKAMKYFFNIENLGYLRYKLRCITSITSRYTYIMFIYLEHNRYRKSWEISLYELKSILGCTKEEYCKQYKVFNDRVLKRIKKEMNEKTECRFTYEAIKSGRFVIKIKFSVENLQKTIAENIKSNQIDDEKKTSTLWADPLEPFEFSQEELDEVFSNLVTVPDYKLPQSPSCYGVTELQRYHYIDQKAKEILRIDKRKSIKNKFLYLLKLIKKDVTEH